MRSTRFDQQEALEMDKVAQIDADLEGLLRARNTLRPDETMVLQYENGELWQPFKPLTAI